MTAISTLSRPVNPSAFAAPRAGSPAAQAALADARLNAIAARLLAERAQQGPAIIAAPIPASTSVSAPVRPAQPVVQVVTDPVAARRAEVAAALDAGLVSSPVAPSAVDVLVTDERNRERLLTQAAVARRAGNLKLARDLTARANAR